MTRVVMDRTYWQLLDKEIEAIDFQSKVRIGREIRDSGAASVGVVLEDDVAQKVCELARRNNFHYAATK
jgi:hypothetical protein